MTEADFSRNDVMPHLLQWGDASRIENTTESGTPDISYAIAGIQGWIELKLIRQGKLTFEKFQLSWLKKRLRHSRGNLWLFATDEEALYIYSAEQLLAAPRYPYKDMIQVLIEDLTPPLVHSPTKPWRWGDVLVLLTRHIMICTPAKF